MVINNVNNQRYGVIFNENNYDELPDDILKQNASTISTPKATMNIDLQSYHSQPFQTKAKEEEKTQKKAFEYAKIH